MKVFAQRPAWQRWVLVGTGLVLVLGIAVWIAMIVLRPGYPSPAEATAKMRAQAALTGGAKVYATHCAYCHNTGFGPSIAGRGMPPAAVATFVRLGPGAMQAFPESQVSAADIVAVATYLNSLPVPTPEQGKQ